MPVSPPQLPRLRMRLTDSAIVSSSSVWMTRTLTERASGEISGAFWASALLV